MFKLKMNFTGELPDVYFLDKNPKTNNADVDVSDAVYNNIWRLTSSEFGVTEYLNKIYLYNNDNNIEVLATLLLDLQNSFRKSGQFLKSKQLPASPQFIEYSKGAALALQALQVFIDKIFSSKKIGGEFSEKSYLLLSSLKTDIKYLFDNRYKPDFIKNYYFKNRLNQEIISLGEQVNIDLTNSKPSKSIVSGPRSADACLLQLIIIMDEYGVDNDILKNEASLIFKSGIVSDFVVNSVVEKLLKIFSIKYGGIQNETYSSIRKIQNSLNFISNKNIALPLAQGGSDYAVNQCDLAIAKNAVHFDSMFTRLYESSLAFKLQQSLQLSPEFKEKMLSPTIAALKMIMENYLNKLELNSKSEDFIKSTRDLILNALLCFNNNHEVGTVENVPSPEMLKHHKVRDYTNINPLTFIKAELKCIDEIATQIDTGKVNMLGMLFHVDLVTRFILLPDHVKSEVYAGNLFYINHIHPSKESRLSEEERILNGKVIRRYPNVFFSSNSYLNVSANNYGSMSAGHIKYYPDGFNKNPEKPNFRMHNSDQVNVKIDRYASDDIRISEENQFILDKGLLLTSGVSGTVWARINGLNKINSFISNKTKNEGADKISEKLFILQNAVSMIQLGGHSFYEAFWSVKEAISQDKILKDDLNAKTMLSSDAVKTENGLEMSIISRSQMLRFLMADIENGEAICASAEEEAFKFVQGEFKKHDKYYQKAPQIL